MQLLHQQPSEPAGGGRSEELVAVAVRAEGDNAAAAAAGVAGNGNFDGDDAGYDDDDDDGDDDDDDDDGDDDEDEDEEEKEEEEEETLLSVQCRDTREWPWGKNTDSDACFEAAERLLRGGCWRPGSNEDYGDGRDFLPRPRKLGPASSWLHRERVFVDGTLRRGRGTDLWKQKGGCRTKYYPPGIKRLSRSGGIVTLSPHESVLFMEYKLVATVDTPTGADQGHTKKRPLRVFHLLPTKDENDVPQIRDIRVYPAPHRTVRAPRLVPAAGSLGPAAWASAATARASVAAGGGGRLRAVPSMRPDFAEGHPRVPRGQASIMADHGTVFYGSSAAALGGGRGESKLHQGTHTFREEGPPLSSGEAPAPYLLFEDAREHYQGEISRGKEGLTLKSAHGDFAEYYPRMPGEEAFEEGDVVGIVEGSWGSSDSARQRGVLTRRTDVRETASAQLTQAPRSTDKNTPRDSFSAGRAPGRHHLAHRGGRGVCAVQPRGPAPLRPCGAAGEGASEAARQRTHGGAHRALWPV
eukprot:COSAG01_NODE_3236_length_6351_cov_4.282823_3_plen_525_part_00